MTTAYDFSFARLGGGAEIALSAFRGQPILVVNVASACGFTPQYRDLQALYEAKAKAGLVILAAPCNDFGRQESGEEVVIKDFCESKYHVTFPMTGKVEIVGAGRHPFYRWIAAEAGEGALPRWNFHKYLIGRDGGLLDGFPSSDAPMGFKMLGAIEAALSGGAAKLGSGK
ncbi:MAG: glutathione peroxidase [Caulobacterales bacterium]|jgi:glutathione peroxidase